MSESNNRLRRLSDGEAASVSGGLTMNFLAAVDVMNGKYGDGEERKRRLTAAGYDHRAVQHLVNGLVRGYDMIALEVIEGKYGNGQARISALRAAGFDPALVQEFVNCMLLD